MQVWNVLGVDASVDVLGLASCSPWWVVWMCVWNVFGVDSVDVG